MACSSCGSPIAALTRGVMAGLAGTFAQNFFFALTRKLAIQPPPPKRPFTPPDPAEADETETAAVAHRVVEGLMKRGPLQDEERAGRLVHYAFGSTWGGLYGVVAGSYPAAATLRGGLAFGALVWLVSDNLLLPAFRLAGPPTAYPLKTHAYALAANCAYGAGVAAAFRASEPEAWRPAVAQLGALWVTRKLPAHSRLRRPTRRLVRGAIHARWRLQDLARAVRG